MEPTHKLIVALCIFTLAVGLTLWYYNTQITEYTTPPSTEPTLHAPSPKPLEHLPVFFLGEQITQSPEKQSQAAQLLATISQRDPNLFGIITSESAPDEIKIILQKTSTALTNFSAIDLACNSIAHPQTPCEAIQKEYDTTHEGFPSHQTLFPPEEGYTCTTIRKAIQPVLAFIDGQCNRLEDPQERQLCEGLPDTCTPTPISAPCDLLKAITSAKRYNTPCSQFTTGQRTYLCQALINQDCNSAYQRMIEDYSYTELALSTNEPGFCEFVEEPHLKEGCLAGNKDTVRNDLIQSYID